MFDNGAKFARVPEFTWSVNENGKSAKLRKELSVSFSVDTVLSSQEILVGFDAAGIDIDCYFHSTTNLKQHVGGSF